MEKNIQKSSPEYTFYHKVAAFFEGDPDIEVGDIENYKFVITVHDERKYETLKKALIIPKFPGNRLHVTIECDATEDYTGISDEEMVYLLESNPYFCRYEAGEENGLKPLMTYILMQPDVVQYYDDIFNNPYGLATTTAEALAKELFRGCRCNITTDAI